MSFATDNVERILNSLERYNVEIVAATKTRSIGEISDIINNTPVKVAGENRVQEFVEKYAPEITWDFIGQLQTNKVKQIAGKVRLIHSVDRISLLETVNKEAGKAGIIQDILIEINGGREENKGGLFLEDVELFAQKVKEYRNVRLAGLMTVAPPDCTRDGLEKIFKSAYALFCGMKNEYPEISKLSMGMSGDYMIAADCGANLLRLGRVIFGERK